MEWRRRAFVRIALVIAGAVFLLLAVKLAATHSQGGRYDAWAEAIGAARRAEGIRP